MTYALSLNETLTADFTRSMHFNLNNQLITVAEIQGHYDQLWPSKMPISFITKSYL